MRGERIRGSGALARSATWTVTALVMLLVAVTWGHRPAGVLLDVAQWQVVEVAVAAVGVVASVRAALLGVWMRDDGMLVRSWVRTWRIPYDRLEAIDLLGYVGLRAQGELPAFVLTPGWRVAGRALIAPQGLAATPDSQRRQVQRMRERVQALAATRRPEWRPVTGDLTLVASRRADRAG